MTKKMMKRRVKWGDFIKVKRVLDFLKKKEDGDALILDHDLTFQIMGADTIREKRREGKREIREW